jgi:uncharacterized protein YdeI (BOF family)
MSFQYAKQRIIKDISVDDKRIQVTGYVKTRIDDDHILLNDDTGELKVDIMSIEDFNFKEGDLINIIGDIELKVSGEKLFKADIVQDMTNLNFEYYKKLYLLKKELNLN